MKHLFLSTVLLTTVLGGAAYAAAGYKLKDRLMPNTMVNGYDLSLLEKDAANDYLSAFARDSYRLAVTDIHGEESVISGEEIDLRCAYPLETMAAQNSYLWPKYLGTSESYEMTPEVHYDEGKLAEIVHTRVLKDASSAEQPRDAFLTGYIPGAGYTIAKERDGDTADDGKVIRVLDAAIRSMSGQVDLAEEDCYLKAAVRSDNAALQKAAADRNKEMQASVTYDLGDQKVVLNSDIYYSWLEEGEDGELQFNKEKLEEYVTDLKKSTDTAYSSRSFRTVSGNVVTLTGPYGFNIAKTAEIEQLTEDLLSGEQIEREPVYTSTGASREGTDYGNSYVEVDLSNQRVYLIEEGQVVLSTDCVTGNTTLHRDTPPGIYPITYKSTNTILRGPGYASHVNYWMPFNGGIGLHDALWRGSFGGTIYRSSGSHGCVNLPYAAAKELYGHVEKGFPVICHF